MICEPHRYRSGALGSWYAQVLWFDYDVNGVNLWKIFDSDFLLCLIFFFFLCFFFFFQAEDGIRDRLVTGVQTCALPICIIQQDEESATRFGLNDGEDTARRV